MEDLPKCINKWMYSYTMLNLIRFTNFMFHVFLLLVLVFAIVSPIFGGWYLMSCALNFNAFNYLHLVYIVIHFVDTKKNDVVVYYIIIIVYVFENLLLLIFLKLHSQQLQCATVFFMKCYLRDVNSYGP